MIQNKELLINQAIEKAKINQYDDSKFHPSRTKLGPCIQFAGQWSGSSWTNPMPIFQDYRDSFIPIGEKYKNLEWLPLDIPKIQISDFDKFIEIWEREKISFIRNLPCDQEPWSKDDHPLGKDSTWYSPEYYGMHITCNATIDFNIYDLYKDGRLTTNIQESNISGDQQGRKSYGVFNKKLYKDKFFSDIITQVMRSFPITRISNMLIVETAKDIPLHREQSWTWKSPTEFRVMLHDENTKPTMYVIDIETGSKTYIDLPEDTNSFCWSNGNKLYGIDYHGKKSYQLIVNAVWSSNKMDILLERSLEKYKNKLNYELLETN